MLEDHLRELRETDGCGPEWEQERDGAAWEGWDVESDSSDESSDGWIDVDSEGSLVDLSDSENESEGLGQSGERILNNSQKSFETQITPSRVSSLATRKVCFS